MNRIAKIIFEDGTEIDYSDRAYWQVQDDVLRFIDDNVIAEYAEYNLGMVEEDEVRYPKPDLNDHDESEMIEYLEQYGWKVLSCQSITEAMTFEEIQDKYKLELSKRLKKDYSNENSK